MRTITLRTSILLVLLTFLAPACRPPADVADDPRSTPASSGEDEEDPAVARDVKPPPPADGSTTGRAGLIVITNSRTFARILQSPREPGVVVLFVQPDGPSADAGLKPGDLIAEVDGRATTNAEYAVYRQLRARPGESRRLRILPAGGGGPRDVNITYRRPGEVNLRNDYYNPMIEQNPEDPILRYLRAQGGGPYAEALEDAEKAVELQPGFTEAISLRAELQWNRSRQPGNLPVEEVDALQDRALRDWRIAQRQDPENTRVMVSYSQALTQAGTARSGREQARKAVEGDSTFPGAHYALALAEWDEARYATAAAPARKAIELNPYDVRYYELLATLFMRLDRRSDARKTVDAIIDLVEDTRTREQLNKIVSGQQRR